MRAVKKVPAAAEVFEVSRLIDTLFGMGEGRLIARGVSAALGVPAKEVRAPGGTRKVVYLAGVPSNLIDNFKLYNGGLHARLAWAQEGKSSQTVASLIGAGRRLASVSFVVFLTLFQDCLEGSIRPYALLVQSAVEPAVGFAAGDRLLASLARRSHNLRRIRALAMVL